MSWLKGLLQSGPERALAKQQEASLAVIDAVLAKVRARQPVSDDDLARAKTAFAALYQAFSTFSGTDDNRAFPEPQRVDFFCTALKMTAIGHRNHDAWPFFSAVRATVFAPLSRRLEREDDPWLAFCAVLPALVHQQVKVALRSFAKIQRDPFLGPLAIAWVDQALMAWRAYTDEASLRAFLEAVKAPSPWDLAGQGLSHEIRWPLLAAVYPYLARDPRTHLADARGGPTARLELAEDWGVVDAAGARKTIASLRDIGHRAQLARDLASPGAESSKERAAFIAANRAALERHGMLAFDLCRAIGVARAALAAGFLSQDETWSAVQEAGRLLRAEYASWDDLAEAFVLGDAYFAGGGPGSPHAAMARWLQRDPRSPWRTVPFGAAVAQSA